MMITERVQKIKIEHLFDVLDFNGNQELQPDDFTAVADRISNKLGYPQDSKKRLNLQVKSVRLFIQLLADVGKADTSISKTEWVQLFDQLIAQNRIKGYVQRTASYIFGLFDQNSDGVFSQEEFLDMFRAYNISDEYVKVAFMKLDENGDGVLSKQEILIGLEEYFMSSDPEAKGNWIFGKWDKNQAN